MCFFAPFSGLVLSLCLVVGVTAELPTNLASSVALLVTESNAQLGVLVTLLACSIGVLVHRLVLRFRRGDLGQYLLASPVP